MIENFSTILTKKFVAFDRCIVTSLNSINFENFDVEFNTSTSIKSIDDDESINIIDMIMLTTENVDSVAVVKSILLLTTRILSIEIVVAIAYVVTQTIKIFLNQSFLCVNFDFLIVKNLTCSVCSKLT